MAYEPLVYTYLEDALAECFVHHAKLDQFLTSCGLPRANLAHFRKSAKDRATPRYEVAPKRFVVQDLLSWAIEKPADSDRLIASIIDALLKGRFPDASQKATDAITDLKNLILSNRETKQRTAPEDQSGLPISSKIAEEELSGRHCLQEKFLTLQAMQDAQKRGFAFEQFLQSLFTHFGLEPRKPFRITGEQIDGSIIWKEKVFLIEAKWTKEKTNGSDFGPFFYKIEGKGADTRGLFISINGYSTEALSALSHKGTQKFICFCGAHLYRALQSENGLNDVLSEAWRHLNETGAAYLPTSEMGR